MVVKIKKQNAQKKCIIKRKLKFETYKNCLAASQLDNEINYIQKMKLMKIVLKKIMKNS